jgi:hypothetical protein
MDTVQASSPPPPTMMLTVKLTVWGGGGGRGCTVKQQSGGVNGRMSVKHRALEHTKHFICPVPAFP